MELISDFKIWLENIFLQALDDAIFYQDFRVLEVLSKHQSGTTFTLELKIKNPKRFNEFELNTLAKLKRELFQIFQERVLTFDTMLRDITTEFYNTES